MSPRRILLLALSVPLIAAAAEDRVRDRVDVNRRVAVPGSRPPQARLQNDLGPVDPATELGEITLLLRPSASLERFLREQQDPRSPNYHKWLTPEQFGERFGLSQPDLDKVAGWLRSEGLQVRGVARGRHWITFGGSAERVGRALGARFRRYRIGGEEHIANADDPTVPAALAGVVAGFEGLHDIAPRPLHVAAQYNDSRGVHYLAPDDFATIYNLKPLYDSGIDGTGMGIAVIGRVPVDLADIQSFRRRYKLPDNDPKMVLVGPEPPRNSSDMAEADLDLEWAGAVARNAAISYVYARSVGTALQYAIDQNIAPVITYSYGTCETFSSPATQYLAQQANAQGITFVASSGDAGAAVCDWIYALTPQAAKGSTLSYPANIPEVTAIGGTVFQEGDGTYWNPSNDANGSSAISYIPEGVWNDVDARGDLGHASTGGPSAYFPKPYWQTGPGVPDDKARDVPDVSLSASAAHVGYLVVNAGSLRAFGGTSAGSPAFAGVVALLNQYLLSSNAISQPGLGNINPGLYRLARTAADAFHDVVSGDNRVPCVQGSPACVEGRLGYSAGPGYDLATGLGAIDAYNLVTKWSNTLATTTVLQTSAGQVDADTPVSLTATVSGAGKTPPAGAVQFLANDIVVASAPLQTAAGATTATATVRGGLLAGAITAYYPGDAVYGPSSATATVGLNIPASGSLVVMSITPNPAPQAMSGSWPFTVTLAEKAGVPTRLTGITSAGLDNSSLIRLFNGGLIPANGKVTVALVAEPPEDPVPGTVLFRVTGQDADGRPWSQEQSVVFTAYTGAPVAPAMALAGAPSAVQQNPAADPGCQWSHDLVLDEHGGYLVLLTKLMIGSQDFTSQIQPLFGTTRLAPYGALRAAICQDRNLAAPSARTYTITGVAENGATLTSSATVAFQPPAASAAPLSLYPQSLNFAAADPAQDQTATLNVGFAGGAPQWKVSVTPANSTTAWLRLTPLSGAGDGKIAVRASAAGLSTGVYRAVIAFEAPGAAPDHFSIPVVLVVGPAGPPIGGIANSASFAPAFAPGMLMSVFIDGLASTSAQASSLPLPLSLSGIRATVNGVAAPILGVYAGAGQVNLQVPYEAGSGPSVLAIHSGGKVSAYPFTLATAAPGLFGVWDPAGRPVAVAAPGQTLVAYITGEGDVTPFVPTGDTYPSGTAASKLPKARQPLSVTVGGVPADILFNGIPAGLAGVTQINFTVPASLAAGDQPVIVTVGGAKSQPYTLTIAPQ